jgi:hypothetical protein
VHTRSFVLLAGTPAASSLSAQLGRSVLDLPITSTQRLLDVWRSRIRPSLAAAQHPDEPREGEILILVGTSDRPPTVVNSAENPRVRITRDAGEFRGTAGVLRDLCDSLPEEEWLVVGVASQCPDEGHIAHLVSQANPDVGVTLTADRDGAPSGLMLLRSHALASIPAIGFIDLKEQALPRIASASGVRVLTSPGGVTPPLRDLRTYLQALRSWHRSGSLMGTSAGNPYEERGVPAFGVVEDGATVAPTARLHDSVVLAGAVVESGCEVVRSVIGPGAVVRRRDRVVGRLVLGTREPAGGAP